MPSSLSTPVLMVGPGTGIAPFMSMCQEREVLLSRLAAEKGPEAAKKEYGGTHVFFGNRYRDKDFLYEKVYVQHKLAEQKDVVWDILGKKEGPKCLHETALIHWTFMLAGNAQKMPNDVRNQVREIMRAVGKMSERDAKIFMLRMDAKRRYVQETWS